MTRFLVSAVAPNGGSIDRQQVDAGSEREAADQFLAIHRARLLMDQPKRRAAWR